LTLLLPVGDSFWGGNRGGISGVMLLVTLVSTPCRERQACYGIAAHVDRGSWCSGRWNSGSYRPTLRSAPVSYWSTWWMESGASLGRAS
jgi:hypothetical protein